VGKKTTQKNTRKEKQEDKLKLIIWKFTFDEGVGDN